MDFRGVFPGCLLGALLGFSAAGVSADENCDLDFRKGFRQLTGDQGLPRDWVMGALVEPKASGAREVAVDEPVLVAEFKRVVAMHAMRAPTDFKFRSGWLLNTQFEFARGEDLQIRTIYESGSGDSYYALRPRSAGHLTIFARADGTLCNKVMNSQSGDHVFLVKKYNSDPRTKLVPGVESDPEGSPLVAKIVYLGSSGGVATFRSLWSRDGKIIEREDVEFDQDASSIEISGFVFPVSKMGTTSVTVGETAVANRIEWSQRWASLFNAR